MIGTSSWIEALFYFHSYKKKIYQCLIMEDICTGCPKQARIKQELRSLMQSQDLVKQIKISFDVLTFLI